MTKTMANIEQYVIEDAKGHQETLWEGTFWVGFLEAMRLRRKNWYSQYGTAETARPVTVRPFLRKHEAQRWFFRKGNPTPIARFDALMGPDGKPVLNRTLDHTLGVQEAATDSMNIRDILPNPTNWGMMILLLGFGLLLGYVVSTVV